MTALQKKASRIGVLAKHKGAAHPETLAARRDLRAAHLEAAIARATAEAPPLTDEQVERLAALLRGGAS